MVRIDDDYPKGSENDTYVVFNFSTAYRVQGDRRNRIA